MTRPYEDKLAEYLAKCGVVTKPLPHQAKGIHFLVRREGFPRVGAPSGGLLSDDMGLGKTFQMIATTLVCRHIDRKQFAERKLATSLAPTLVVVPKTLLLQWKDEILHHTNLSPHHVVIYHGDHRKHLLHHLEGVEFVLTTYHTVRLDYVFPPEPEDGKPRTSWDKTERVPFEQMGPLFRRVWDRIILDEAHQIRNDESKISRACIELRGRHRWCLTGTAFNNKPNDLATLCKFLRVGDEFMKSSWWETASKDKLKAWRARFMLRRTKDILNLPPLTQERHLVAVTEEEQRLYDGIITDMAADYREFLAASGVERRRLFVCLLTWLLRMRQACNDPLLIFGRQATRPYARLAKGKATAQGCSRCEAGGEDDDEKTVKLVRLACGHAACFDCQHKPCVYCRFDLNPSGALHASKTTFLVRRLLDVLEKDSTRKIIVYSQWTSYMDRLEGALRDVGIGHIRLDGDVTSVQERASLLDMFRSDDTPVLLASLHAGGLGLNLTAASHVFFLDAWFNPMVELQAMNRVHRIGQTRPVHVEFITSNLSVEEYLLALQDKKKAHAEYYMDGDELPPSSTHGGGGINAQELTGLFAKILAKHRAAASLRNTSSRKPPPAPLLPQTKKRPFILVE